MLFWLFSQFLQFFSVSLSSFGESQAGNVSFHFRWHIRTIASTAGGTREELEVNLCESGVNFFKHTGFSFVLFSGIWDTVFLWRLTKTCESVQFYL